MDHGHMLPVRVFMNVHHGLTVSGGARRTACAARCAQPSRNSVRTLTSIVSHKLKIVWWSSALGRYGYGLCVSYSPDYKFTNDDDRAIDNRRVACQGETTSASLSDK